MSNVVSFVIEMSLLWTICGGCRTKLRLLRSREGTRTVLRINVKLVLFYSPFGFNSPSDVLRTGVKGSRAQDFLTSSLTFRPSVALCCTRETLPGPVLFGCEHSVGPSTVPSTSTPVIGTCHTQGYSDVLCGNNPPTHFRRPKGFGQVLISFMLRFFLLFIFYGKMIFSFFFTPGT